MRVNSEMTMIPIEMWRTSACVFLCLGALACGDSTEGPAPIVPGTPSGPLGGVAPHQPTYGVPGVVPLPTTPSIPPGVPIPHGTPIAPAVPVPPGGSNFGTMTLASGFMPDPFTVTGHSGGEVSAETLSPSCRGHIAQQPDHLFNATSSFTSLRFLVNGGSGDTTLVIQTPSGQFLCDDDSEGRNPIVVATGLQPGMYKIWVGSYVRGERTPYTLALTELSSITAASLAMPDSIPTPSVVAPLVPTLPTMVAPATTHIALAPGFLPDPNVVSGVSGGSQAASALDPSCSGWVGQAANHSFTANGHFSTLHILVNAPIGDTTLVIRRPDGTYLCNDDDNGLNPAVHVPFPPGVYQIFVGAYHQGQQPAYRLGLSELSGLQPEQLDQP